MQEFFGQAGVLVVLGALHAQISVYLCAGDWLQWRRTASVQYDTREMACPPDKDVERLHCYPASRTSHHLPAYRGAIAITCAQHILKAVLVALAGIAIQGL